MKSDLTPTTSEGANIEGNVNVGGNFIGRDYIQGENHTIINIQAHQLSIPTNELEFSGAQLENVRYSYLKWIIERNSYLDPRGTFQVQRQVQLRLDEIYVSLQAQAEINPTRSDRYFFEQELSYLEKQEMLSALPSEEIKARRNLLASRIDATNDTKVPERTRVSLHEAINNHNRLIILGDPGSGKTTLLKYLALQHANSLFKGAIVGEMHPKSDLGKVCFPIQVRIADYAENQIWKSIPFSNFLARSCALTECPEVGIDQLIQSELSAGNVLILLDGLDEVVEADDRRSIVQRIDDFTRRYISGGKRGQNLFVVTSRLAGYRSAPLDAPFAHYVIEEMNDEQISFFLTRWCKAVEDAQTPDISDDLRIVNAQREVSGIMKAVSTNPGVRRLAANPLMLRTLALIHRTGANLPQRRIELYKLAADTLSHTWRTAQGVPESALIDERYITRLLGKIAYWLHENKPTGMATENEVYNILGEEWARINRLVWDENDPDPTVENEVAKFLASVREHTGLFVERAPRRYGFMHLTFEEYYTARYLVARRREAATMIRQHLHNARWDEPILLALGFVGMDYPDESAELFEISILAQGEEASSLGLEQSTYELLLARDFLFALRCMGDRIPIDRYTGQKLLNRLISELLELFEEYLPLVPLCFPEYQQALWERASYLEGHEEFEQMLSDLLLKTLQEENHDSYLSRDKKAQAIFEIIGRVSKSSITIHPILTDRFEHQPIAIRKRLIVILGQLTNKFSIAFDLLISFRNDWEQDPEMSEFIESNMEVLQDSEDGLLESSILDIDIVELDEMWNGIVDVEETSYIPSSHTDSFIEDTLANVYTKLNITDKSIPTIKSLDLKRPQAEIVYVLLKVLKHSEKELRKTAAGLLLFLDTTDFAIDNDLFDSLQENSPEVRQYIALLLGKRGVMNLDTQKILVEALENSPIRWEAANILGQLGVPDELLFSKLIQNLIHADQNVVSSCMEALLKLSKRFPQTIVKISEELAYRVNQSDRTTRNLKNTHYAYQALWMLFNE